MDSGRRKDLVVLAPGEVGGEAMRREGSGKPEQVGDSVLGGGDLGGGGAAATGGIKDTVGSGLFDSQRPFIAAGFDGESEVPPLGAIDTADLNEGTAVGHCL